jgi:hypothetical protein
MNPKRAVGISWKTRLDGDFTTTATFNIERVDRPGQGSGVGVEMYLTLDTPEPRDAIVFTRVLQPGGETTINFFLQTNDERKNRFGKLISRQATSPRSLQGRLRLARTGKVFVASIAEGADDEFKEIGRQEIGDMRVLKVRFAGVEGSCLAPELDMRLVDFKLVEKYVPSSKQAPTSVKIAPAPKDDKTEVLPVEVTPVQPTPASSGSSLWIIIILGGVFLLLVLGVIALVVVVRMCRRS